MTTEKRIEQANELVKQFFGIDAKEVMNKTSREEEMEKMVAYRNEEELGRAQLYALEVSDNVRLKRQIVEFSQEFVTTIRTFEMYDYIPAAYRRETMRFFNSHFAKFDKNAANALGQHLKRGLDYVKEQPGSLIEKGNATYLSNVVMRRLLERSRNAFFREVQKNATLRDQFKKRLDNYCGLVWTLTMQEEGTIYADMPLADKVAQRVANAEQNVEQFLNEKCSVKTTSKTLATKLYEEYESWTLANAKEMIGRRKFNEAIFSVIPFARQQYDKGKSYIYGINLTA